MVRIQATGRLLPKVSRRNRHDARGFTGAWSLKPAGRSRGVEICGKGEGEEEEEDMKIGRYEDMKIWFFSRMRSQSSFTPFE